MKDFSYTKTPSLTSQIRQIEDLRKDLLLLPLSPRLELQFQWKAILHHIHYALALTGIEISEEHIIQIISPEGKKKLSENEKHAVKYKGALDYLYHNWLVVPEPVTSSDLVNLYFAAFDGKLKISMEELEKTLQYIQVNPDNPIIQASLAQFLILNLYPFDKHNESFSHLVFLLFLYKNGYDFRRMLALEKVFFQDLSFYKDNIARLGRETNVTNWLEYVSQSIQTELEILIKTVSAEKQTSTQPSSLELNERQKKILSLLNQPGLKINNKKVQEIFNVSQITASRDLSKMVSVGLVIAIGAGRSTYYTKV